MNLIVLSFYICLVLCVRPASIWVSGGVYVCVFFLLLFTIIQPNPFLVDFRAGIGLVLSEYLELF